MLKTISKIDKDLSVVIVNWNTKKLLENCLISIFKFTKNLSFEVIVVDNNSHDASSQMVAKKFPQVKLIKNQENLGYAKANNQGIRLAKGKYILLLNSDTYLVENSFKKLANLAGSLKNLGALGPLLLNPDKSIQQSVGFFPHLPQIIWWMSFIDDLPGGTFLKPYHVDHDSFYQKDQQADWLTGAAFFIPRQAVEKVGTLDEKIFMYGEDVDWCFRAKKAGFNIYFSPITKIIHIGRGSTSQISKNAILGEYRGILYFYRKHKGKMSLQLLHLALKIGALARICIFGALGIIFRNTARKETAKFYVEAFKIS